MPKIYVIPTDSPNAFATGRNPKHASVAVTEGILNLLNDEELEGVLAHELGHVNNRDILISSVAATIAGAITWLRYGAYFGGMGDRDDRRGGAMGGLLMLILAPIAAMMIQMAVSRSREYAGGRNRSALYRQSLRSGQRVGQTRCLLASCPHDGNTVHSAPVHHSAAAGHEFWQPVLHPPADRQAHRALDGTAGRVCR